MKKHTLSLLFLLFSSATFVSGQTHSFDLPQNYIGIGTGFNATGIVGLTYEHIFKDRFGAYANAGLGSWGYKLGVGGRFYFKNPHSGAIGLNLSHCTGATGVKSELGVIQNGQSVQKEVEYDAHPVEVLNISYLKFWQMGKKSRFNIEAGYSIPLNGKSSSNYTIVTPGIVLDETSENALTVVQPGGLILAIGFTFGL